MSTRQAGRPTSFALPFFVTRRNKTWVGALVFAVGMALYLLSNHIRFFEARLLPMSWVDLHVPFWPNTFWVYNSEYMYFILIYSLCNDIANLNRFVYSLLALVFVSVLIFWIWPTVYPRGEYVLPEDLNAFTKSAFNQLRRVDTPGNCCPSLHVSGVYLFAFVFLKEQRSKFFIFLVWGTLIAISTLTTKQHYLIDVFTGLGMAVLFYFLFSKVVRYRDLA